MSVQDELDSFLWTIINPFLYLMLPVFVIAAVIAVVEYIKYKKSSYYSVTKLPYLFVFFDKGRYGEYQTYKKLRYLEEHGAKFLFNIYVPKENEETSEIDVLMLCKKGIFVFESKNYSGWIFGSENQKNWYQTLPRGKGKSNKESFYNPIMQNASHIKHLKNFIGSDIPMQSVVVFSERCTLKNISLNNKEICVVKRDDLSDVVSKLYKKEEDDILCANEIESIYNKLYPLTQVSDAVKEQHIVDIAKNCDKESVSEKAENNTPDVEDEVLKCPKCGGELVLKTAQRGKNAGNRFYGCSNYPHCRYIRNFNEEN